MKTYIEVAKNENGMHNDQSNGFFEHTGIPGGWVEIPEGLMDSWEAYKPFVHITAQDGVVTSIAADIEARDAWEAADQTDLLNQIAALKQNLSDSDYKAVKFAEGLLTAEEYEPIKQQRQAWRAEINTLEAQLTN